MKQIDEVLKWVDDEWPSFTSDASWEYIAVLAKSYRSEKAKLEKVQLEMGKASKWLEEEITRREEVEEKHALIETEHSRLRANYDFQRGRADGATARAEKAEAEIAIWKRQQHLESVRTEKAEAELKNWKDCEYESQVKMLESKLAIANTAGKETSLAYDRAIERAEKSEDKLGKMGQWLEDTRKRRYDAEARIKELEKEIEGIHKDEAI